MAEASTTLQAGVEFRTIFDLALRCGHYCWLENQLFALTGQWASGPAAAGAATGTAADPAADHEIRVLSSQMSSWHGFLAGQWHDRLPVRAGVDVGTLVVPPPGGLAGAFALLETVPDLAVRLAGLVDPILTGLLAAYDDEVIRASPVSELPVLAVLELARRHARQEIEAGRELVEQGPAARPGSGPGTGTVSELRDRLQLLLGADRGIFPAVPAS